MPSRTLNAAIDFFALVTIGFLAGDGGEVGHQRVHDLDVLGRSPSPMLTTIFSSRGIAIALVMPSSLAIAGRISVIYFSLNRAAIGVARFLHGFRGGLKPVYRFVGEPSFSAWPLASGFSPLS